MVVELSRAGKSAGLSVAENGAGAATEATGSFCCGTGAAVTGAAVTGAADIGDAVIG